MIALFNLTRATYEADLADFPHAFVGCARTDAAVIVSHLARLDMMPLMSFAATATEFAGEDVCTYTHTHTHTHTHTIEWMEGQCACLECLFMYLCRGS